MKYYSTNEVAEIIGVTRRTVYNYIESGKLKATKPAGRYAVSEKELKRFMNRPINYKF